MAIESRTQRVWSDLAIPPGATIAEELVARGISQSELARRMERPQQAINEILRGVKAITADTALQLERVLGISAEFWMQLEGNYRLTKARLKSASHPMKPHRRTTAQSSAHRLGRIRHGTRAAASGRPSRTHVARVRAANRAK